MSQANDLLAASYQLYQQANTNDTALRTDSYAPLSILHAHVQTVVPTTLLISPCADADTAVRFRVRYAAVPPTKGVFEEPVTVLSNRDENPMRTSFRVHPLAVQHGEDYLIQVAYSESL